MALATEESALKTSLWKNCLVACLWLFFGLQLLPYGHLETGPADSLAALKLEGPLGMAIRRSCFDCHARERPLPWYGRVAPLSWWMVREKRRAQAAVDFSRWEDYTSRQQAMIWERSLLRVIEGSMPPMPYHLVHPTLSKDQVLLLQKHLVSLEPRPMEPLEVAEMMAWPATRWSGGPVREVMRVDAIDLSEPLVMDGGLLLVDGSLKASFGLQGHGAIYCRGEVTVSGLTRPLGPLVLIGGADVSLSAVRPVLWQGLVLSGGQLRTEKVEVKESPDLRLTFPDVREGIGHFCRDDGEIGEYAERVVVVRYKAGEYVLWEPEFSAVARAADSAQALEQLEILLGRDQVMDLEAWKADFRESWAVWLNRLATDGKPAVWNPRSMLPPLSRPSRR